MVKNTLYLVQHNGQTMIISVHNTVTSLKYYVKYIINDFTYGFTACTDYSTVKYSV